jgi:hypothetical protein
MRVSFATLLVASIPYLVVAQDIDSLIAIRASVQIQLKHTRATVDSLAAISRSLDGRIRSMSTDSSLGITVYSDVRSVGYVYENPDREKRIGVVQDKARLTVLDFNGTYFKIRDESGLTGWISRFNTNSPSEEITARLDAHNEAMEEDERAKAIEAGAIVWIDSSTYETDSAGGVSPTISFTNLAEAAIKYAYFEMVPINGVGDPVVGQTSGKTGFMLTGVGPIPAGSYARLAPPDPVFYGRSTTCIELVSVTIEYRDGRESTARYDDLDKAHTSRFRSVYLEGECFQL